jgi:NAD(P)-dependent dehydrogenase (short-subunit alcohol dehydrogenase family)
VSSFTNANKLSGRSVAIKFAATYPVVLISRSASSYESIVSEINKNGGKAIGVAADVADSASLKSAFETIKKELGDAKLAAAVYNVGGGFTRKPFLQLTEKEYTAGYESNGLGFFNFAQLTLPLLLDSVSTSPHPPSLLITGATASLRGSAQCASFAAGKFALRATGQSLAREFGPQGIHIAHAIIDGGIDGPRHSGLTGDKKDTVISPDAIADAYWWLHTQPRSTFTQELDIRPYVEKF